MTVTPGRNISITFCMFVHSKNKKKNKNKNKKNTKKREEGTDRRFNGKHKITTNQTRAQGAVQRTRFCCLLVRSVLEYVELMDRHKHVTSRPDGRQKDKKRAGTKS